MRMTTNLYQTIERDCAFLSENNLIDYSMLIGEIYMDQIAYVKKCVA